MGTVSLESGQETSLQTLTIFFFFLTWGISHIINLLGAVTSGLGSGATPRHLLWWPMEYVKLDRAITKSPPEFSLWLTMMP